MKYHNYKRVLTLTLICLSSLFYLWGQNNNKIDVAGVTVKHPTEQALNIQVFFGYKDARPARFVADRYESEVFVHLLMSDCNQGRNDCEFKKILDPVDPGTEILQKKIISKQGIRKVINLKVFSSSVTADDVENRRNLFQNWKSNYVKKEFVKALQTADVIFYNGHSRAGGGPDFSPPQLTRSNHVNYVFYQKKRPGLNLILDTLKKNQKSPLKIIGMFSCKSDQLFKEKIEASKPFLKLIGSRQLLYFSDALNQSLNQLVELL